MKDMKKAAAKFGYYQINDIPAEIANDEYFAKQNKQPNKTIPEGFILPAGLEIGVFASIREQKYNNTKAHELYYIETFRILVYSKELDLLMFLQTNNKDKYYLYPIYEAINPFSNNLESSERRDILETLTEPNHIGVFTEKKVLAWVNYSNELLNAYKEANKRHNDKVDTNRKEMERIKNSFPNAKINDFQDSVIIDTKLFCIQLELQAYGTYLNKKVTYKGTIDDIIEISK